MIAQYPTQKRSDSRLLVLNRHDGSITDGRFYDLHDFLDSNHFMVLNDSKVYKARLIAHRATGGKVEIFLVRRLEDHIWLALLRPSSRIKKGEYLFFDRRNHVEVLDESGGIEREIRFSSLKKQQFIISRYGHIPLPPYIKREADKNDSKRYQTVYAGRSGSVAAPTAGLHFEHRVLARLREKRIKLEMLTLHVGPGTFKPVVVEDIEKHKVDPEFAVITAKTARSINNQKQKGKKLLAVGTTSVRTIESVSDRKGHLTPIAGMVDLFIYPPYGFRTVDAMITNFHLPKTSLLMLVAAFCGKDLLFTAYEHAIKKGYRFYSYGDCMLIL
jgi:S-adenosylmethionine:tRNA ribosyltransferase-isomerase